jgi:hypothetical protein
MQAISRCTANGLARTLFGGTPCASLIAWAGDHNAEPDYREFVCDPSNGFRSISAQLSRPTEQAIKE